jgi:chromosome segregation ATPase
VLQVQAVQSANRQRITSPTFRAKITEIERSQAEVVKALRRTGGPVAARLSSSLEPQTRELVEQAYTLAQRGQDIEHYLTHFNRRTLQEQINQLDKRVQRTSDQYTIDQLRSTREALEQQLEHAQVLETYIGRIKSQLDNIDANLDTMPPQLMRMRASDADASMASSQVAQHLSDLNADMSAFVSVLDNALDKTRAGAA